MRVVGGVMAATLSWGPKRREAEEEEALDQLRKQKEAMMKLQSGLEQRGGPVNERDPALEEALRKSFRAEVVDGNKAVMGHWQLEKLAKEVQPLLTEEQLMRWVLFVSMVDHHFPQEDKEG